MNISESFEEIFSYSHFWNWSPDWVVAQKVYEAFPESCSVLSPFAYSYLEELIRSTTSEYGMDFQDERGRPKRRKVGIKLIQLAIDENKPNSSEFVSILEEIKIYFSLSQSTDEGDNRNSVAHGYMHPRFWKKESFEKLIDDIARLSKYAGF
ncbi:hypothetical protein [Owenweeksia hongkongensis]|uniref:hypothetical protein n=1 Tax=Owenweeksia hongkongensis TaxID=253245 RepID=UPI003A8F6252